MDNKEQGIDIEHIYFNINTFINESEHFPSAEALWLHKKLRDKLGKDKVSVFVDNMDKYDIIKPYLVEDMALIVIDKSYDARNLYIKSIGSLLIDVDMEALKSWRDAGGHGMFFQESPKTMPLDFDFKYTIETYDDTYGRNRKERRENRKHLQRI